MNEAIARFQIPHTAIWLVACFAIASCTGAINTGVAEPSMPSREGEEGASGGTQGGPQQTAGMPGATCGVRGAGPWSMRKLSRTEYNNTVADLLNDVSEPAATFPHDQILVGFDNNSGAATVSDLLVEQYEAAAIALATKATQNPTAFMGCQATETESACGLRFVSTFGTRALRRPLDADEKVRYAAFFDASRTQYGLASATRMLMQAFLQAPSFIYRTELSTTSATANELQVSPYELASRLSYLLWSSMPDAALFASAELGKLSMPDELATQTRRMLKDPRAAKGIANLYGQWLDTAAVLSADKDPATYTKWTKSLPALLRKETETFFGALVLDGNGTIGSLFSAPFSYMNKELADFYGVRGPAGPQFEKVNLDAKRFTGILSQASLLAANASPRQTNPVKRGFYVRERFLCAPPPPPPANLKVSPPPPDGQRTTRERFAEHRKMGSSCEGCHQLMDPVGLGFEHFDGIGLWRDQDVGQPVDATGTMFDTIDMDGPFDGVAELAKKLSGSRQVASCLVRQHFRFAFGRGEQDDDSCTLKDLEGVFEKSGGNLTELLVAVTQTAPFLHRLANNGARP